MAKSKKHSKFKKVLSWTLISAMLGVGAWTVLTVVMTGEPPKEIARPINEVTVFAKHAVNEVQGNNPQITLGRKGGEYELDLCDGTFIEYEPYAEADPNLQPTFVAHNLCGGDPLLYVREVGEKVDIVNQQGVTETYQVTEIRDIVSVGTTSDLEGIKGDIVLQTCNLDDVTIHFVALSPVKKSGTVEQSTGAPVQASHQ